MLLVADAVCFDVDSTIVQTEGIDLLGKCFGIETEIAHLTAAAMNGNCNFQDAMAQRLHLLAEHGMTRDSLDACIEAEGVPLWSPYIKDVMELLHRRGTDIYLVS